MTSFNAFPSHDCTGTSTVPSPAACWERSRLRQEGTLSRARVDSAWTVSAAPGKLACFLIVFFKEKMKGSQGFTCTKCSVPAEAERPRDRETEQGLTPERSPRCVGRGRLT